MSAACCRVRCDVPGCKSYIELSDPGDLENKDKAVKDRAWNVIVSNKDGNKTTKYACFAHAREDALREVLGTVE